MPIGEDHLLQRRLVGRERRRAGQGEHAGGAVVAQCRDAAGERAADGKEVVGLMVGQRDGGGRKVRVVDVRDRNGRGRDRGA